MTETTMGSVMAAIIAFTFPVDPAKPGVTMMSPNSDLLAQTL